jgi:hypothetical protein
VQSPYTPNPQLAFTIVEGATGAALTALLWYRSLRPRPAAWLFFAAIWIVALLPDAPEFFRGIGFTISPTTFATSLKVAAALATLAMFVASPHWLGFVALAGELGLFWVVKNVTESDGEVQAIHLAWFGALLGAAQLVDQDDRPARASTPYGARSYVGQDVLLATVATVLAAVVSTVLLMRACDSADEWANTYQASVFAKFHAFATTPPCAVTFQNFWVFMLDGRNFSQYTPGWPLFMAPFIPLRAAWLAGPVSFGILVAGIARVTRRAARGAFGAREDRVGAAGVAAALVTMASSTLLINGGSRFPHVFVCACFAWSIEALAVITSPPLPERAQWRWGIVLGLAAAWMLSSRPGDGATLGCGLALYFVYAAARVRVPWRGFVGATAAFVFFSALTLVILRLQLGKWFTTGYSMTTTVHPWAKFGYSVPKLNELRWGIPLVTGSYCWWPLCPALGLAGLVAALRGEGRRVGFMLVMGLTPLLAFYSSLSFGRGVDFGYGPRYELAAIVPMAIGTGVALAPLWTAARLHTHARRAFAVGGPLALVFAAFLCGNVRLAPLVYPITHADVMSRNTVYEAARADHLKNAIVWIEPHTTQSDLLDLTQNYPLEMYPDQSILYVSDRGPELKKCVRDLYPTRREYHTTGTAVVSLIPE